MQCSGGSDHLSTVMIRDIHNDTISRAERISHNNNYQLTHAGGVGAESPCMSMFRNLDSSIAVYTHLGAQQQHTNIQNTLINMQQSFTQLRSCSRASVTTT